MPIEADDFAGIGPFNFNCFSWFAIPALEHDQIFEDVRDGKLPAYWLWVANVIFFRRVAWLVFTIPNTSKRRKLLGLVTLVLSIIPILAWTLWRYLGAVFGFWRK